MKTRSRPLLVQSNLFQPLPQRPLWKSLPTDLQQRVKELLIQLLREHQNPRAADPREKEGDHE